VVNQFMLLALDNAVGATILAALVLFAARFIRDPATRHWLWLIVMLRLVVPVHLPLSIRFLATPDHRQSTAPIDREPQLVDGSHRDGDAAPRFEPEVGAALNVDVEKYGAGASAGRQSDLPATTAPVMPGTPRVWHVFNWQELLLGIWLTGTIAWSWVAIRRLVRFHAAVRKTGAAPARATEITRQVAARLQCPHRPEIRISNGSFPPLLWVIGRPVIVVPSRILSELDDSELSAVIAHEVCHLKRRDNWVRWFEVAVLGFCWWHPVAWFASRRLREAEDQACDAEVVRSFQGIERSYAQGLLKILDWATDGPAATSRLATGLGETHSFKERIESMLDHATRQPMANWKRTTIALIVAVMLPLSLRFVAADEPGAPANGDKSSPSADKSAPSAALSEKSADKDVHARVAALIETLHKFKGPSDRPDEFMAAIRELTQIGSPAVGPLTDELSKADDEMMLRLLGFALRAIGDTHAIPALIEAMPKTLMPSSSGFGLRVDEPKLMAFALEHDLDRKEYAKRHQKAPSDFFGFGTPVQEICSALIELSKVDLDEMQLYRVFLEGGPRQIDLKRDLYRRATERRRAWWRDAQHVLLGTRPQSEQDARHMFPTGPDVVAGGGYRTFVSSIFSERTESLLDLDTGLSPRLPNDFAQPKEAIGLSTDFQTWAAQQGVDVMGMEIGKASSKERFHVLRRLELHAWEIPKDRDSSVVLATLQSGGPLELGRPVTSDYLIHWDEQKQAYDPATPANFLFVTREGAAGILQILEQRNRFYMTPDGTGLPDAGTGENGWHAVVEIEYHLFFEKHKRRTPTISSAIGPKMKTPKTDLPTATSAAAKPATEATATTPATVPTVEEPADAKVTSWPEGTTVKGRVVDADGAAVASAEVLLLGEERIIVDSDRLNWFVRSTEKGKGFTPPSTHTNSKGEFSIQRAKGDANRLAVISKDPLFWEVTRGSLPDGDDVEIKLPEAGALAIWCDLPGKPAKMPVEIELRTFDGVDWNPDMLRVHFGESSIANPDLTVFEHLPPALYAVERGQQTRTGEHEILNTFADRQLAKIEPNKRTMLRIERKIGHPLRGQVRGLEKVDLRYALVTVMYWGPEEQPSNYRGPVNKGDASIRRLFGETSPKKPPVQRARFLTAFDVIPVTSEGGFTTDPIPPGKYWVDAFAVRKETQKESPLSPQSSDFEGRLEFTVPETGETPLVEIIAKPRVAR
jgi:beta-lactamase regulating signal transducer with metallopeptidase domain